MRAVALVVLLLCAAVATSGCVKRGEGGDPPPTPTPEAERPPIAEPPIASAAPPGAGPSPTPTGDRGPDAVSPAGTPTWAREPKVVIAHIDTGINPYHAAFRDGSALAHVHPSRYLPGYPAGTPALNLTLNASTLDEALKADAAVWKSVKPKTLYWIPGTRIVGAISFEPGGADCPVVPVPPANVVSETCEDRLLLDDHGHGTMTASRMAGAPRSLAPTARIVSIEGLGGDSVRWAADQGWIDVQTNSWGSLVPHAPGAPDAIRDAFAHAATRTATFAASGNGLAFFLGFTTWPTLLTSTGPAGVILVGAHDNGRAALWSGAPPHVVADGYGGYAASRSDLSRFEPDPIACCTSAASPYAAGGAAALILEARRALGDNRTGIRDGVVASGQGFLRDGALADGNLTLAELLRIYLHAAEARPLEGADDGLLHWTANPTGGPSSHVPAFGPGANPFCQGCVTAPVEWRALPADAPLYPFVGYGASNERALALGREVLAAAAAEPARAEEDEMFAADQDTRERL